jgi:hypothetical protein
MSLRIRRGTDSQRQGITPLEGELLYATDTKKLYVGDGSTGGGIVVDSSAGTSTLNDLANVTAPSPNTNDIIKWNGSAWITAAQNAPAALNDLTNVSASPTTGQSLIWSGSAWVAGQPYGDGSDLNTNIISNDSTIMVNVATSAIAASSITASSVTANFIGDVFAEDGVNKVVSNGAVFGQAQFTGDLTGSVIGSIYTDNSSKIIDGQTGLITGDLIGDVTGNLVGAVTTGTHLDVILDQALDGNDGLVLNMHRGTDAVKLEPNNNDRTFIKWTSWNGSAFADDALIGAYHKTGGGALLALTPAQADGTVFTTAIEMDGVLGTIVINTTDKVTSNAPIESTKYLRVGSYATGALPGTAAGTIAFDSTTNTFKGYNGSAWVALDTQ